MHPLFLKATFLEMEWLDPRVQESLKLWLFRQALKWPHLLLSKKFQMSIKSPPLSQKWRETMPKTQLWEKQWHDNWASKRNHRTSKQRPIATAPHSCPVHVVTLKTLSSAVCYLSASMTYNWTWLPWSQAQAGPVPDIVSTLLIHTVVRQVHELVPNILGSLIITHSGKPDGKDRG